jgi:hypothetical protein
MANKPNCPSPRGGTSAAAVTPRVRCLWPTWPACAASKWAISSAFSNRSNVMIRLLPVAGLPYPKCRSSRLTALPPWSEAQSLTGFAEEFNFGHRGSPGARALRARRTGPYFSVIPRARLVTPGHHAAVDVPDCAGHPARVGGQ